MKIKPIKKYILIAGFTILVLIIIVFFVFLFNKRQKLEIIFLDVG